MELISQIVDGWIIENDSIGIISSFDSDPILNSCIIQENGDYSISMYADNIKKIEGNMSIVANGKNSIRVEGETVNTGKWKNHNVPYVITGNISVADGKTLTIDPGNKLRFNGDYIFEVNGALIAEGTESDNITFTSNKTPPSPGDWRRLSFFLSDPGTKLNYCKILYGGSNTAALNINLSNFSITNTDVKYSEQRGINISQSSPTIRGCNISENLGNGIHIMSGQTDLGTVKDPGNNIFLDHVFWEVYNNTSDTIYAQQNYWGEIDSAEIDNNHIFDDDENPSKEIVMFMPYLKTIPTDVEDENNTQIPTYCVLHQNFPNPFNPSTTIRFSISEESNVLIVVLNPIGEEVTALVNENIAAGSYEVEFDGSDLTSGIYFYNIQAGSFIETKKMVLMK
jgi:hypothetical protein